jgi:hypothetical protein
MQPPTRSRRPRDRGPHDPASRDVLWSWFAVILMIVPFVTEASIMNRLDWDLSFTVAMSIFGASVMVLLLLAAAAINLGLRARRTGLGAGIFPAAVAGTIGGYLLPLALATMIAHLLGME